MIRVSLKYAAFCGIFITAIFHVSFLLNSNPLIDVSHLIFDLIIFGLFVFFSQKEFKVYHTSGTFHFWQGMTIGLLVYLIASFLFGIGLFVYFSLFDHALEDYKLAASIFLESKSDIYKAEFGDKGFADQLDKIQGITAIDLITTSVLKKILAGFFITPVISIILRRQSNY